MGAQEGEHLGGWLRVEINCLVYSSTSGGRQRSHPRWHKQQKRSHPCQHSEGGQQIGRGAISTLKLAGK